MTLVTGEKQVIHLKSLTQNRTSMKHDRESLANALNATTETLSEFDTEIFRFSDSRLRYEMHLHPNSGTALLAADPAEPIQGCPMLEFSFRCTDILVGSSAYSDTEDEVAIRFYEGDVSTAGLRLTLTWIPIGYWYTWANANTQPYAKSGG